MSEIQSRNPATGEIVRSIAEATPAEIDAAVLRSHTIQKKWAKLTYGERAQYLLRLRNLILDNADSLAQLISEENGKPKSEAISADIFPVLELITLYAKKTEGWLKPESVCLGKWALFGRKSWIEYHPIGVMAIVSPWNFPFSIPMGQIAICLMAGNSVILKPSEVTPRIGLAIGDLCRRAGLHPDLVQVLSGDGAVGGALVAHPQINKIIFTGSVETGKKIMAAASANLTPITLELGGKDAMIILDDANLEVASSAALWGAFTNCGQCCASVERIYIDETRYSDFVRLLLEKGRRLHVGAHTNATSDIGPMTFERQREKVKIHVEDAKNRGAVILWQAPTPEGRDGFFYPPTILSHVDHSFPIVMEETFGPVLPIMTFKTEAEAIALANDSPYGLTASVWTKNRGRGERIAQSLEVGTVSINEVTYTFALSQTPWGGPKKSGIGRTHGRAGLLEMVEPKHIHVNRFSGIKSPWWYPYSNEKARGLLALATVFFNPSFKARLRAIPQLRFLRNVL